MNNAFKKTLCQLVTVALVMAPFSSGQASMISTEQVNSTAAIQLDRDVVTSYLGRAETVSQFQANGLDTQKAVERVAAMSNDEVHSLAGQVNAVPAGGDGLVAVILVVFFIWYFAFRR